MNILFIHQNFPGQYLHLAGHLRDLGGHKIVGLGEASNIRNRGTLPGISTVGYRSPPEAGQETHHYLKTTEAGIRRGQAVARALISLKKTGFHPDVVSLHPGWGDGLFVRDIFPDTPILMFCEFYFRAGLADLGFDPEFPVSMDWSMGVRIRNTQQVMSLLTANLLLSPTLWQASRYPDCLQKNMRVLHDGIDTAFMCPAKSRETERLVLQPLQTPGESRLPDWPSSRASSQARYSAEAKGAPVTLTAKDKVVTYIGRNLEPYRGFHIFLRSLPELQRRHPDAHILIVGNDGTSYSPQLPDGQTYKELYLRELGGGLNLERIHFLGQIPYPALRALFRVSSAHVYLTYPFVLSWSALEAMACEGLLVASRTPPVEEVMTHNHNALLVNFFDHEALADCLDHALSAPEKYRELRKNARKTVVADYNLQDSLKRHTRLLADLAEGKYPAPW